MDLYEYYTTREHTESCYECLTDKQKEQVKSLMLEDCSNYIFIIEQGEKIINYKRIK